MSHNTLSDWVAIDIPSLAIPSPSPSNFVIDSLPPINSLSLLPSLDSRSLSQSYSCNQNSLTTPSSPSSMYNTSSSTFKKF